MNRDEHRQLYIGWLRSLIRRDGAEQRLKRERVAVLPALAGLGVLAWYVLQADPVSGPYGVLPLVVGFCLVVPLIYFNIERSHR